MKTNVNVFLRLFAAIVRNFFPRLAVKYFTKKTNPNCEMFLPGSNEELDLIKQLKFGSEQLQERVWSLETKACLLARCNWALLPEIRTEKEFISVLQTGDIVKLIQALRYYTPNKERLEGLICRFGVDTVQIIEAIPSVFDSLAPWEVLGVGEKNTYGLDGKRWALAQALAKAKAAWAPKFMRELIKFPPQKLGETGKAMFEAFFKRALEAKEDISDMMPYLYVFFPELYVLMRKNIYGYNSVYPYFQVMYKQLRQKLSSGQAVTDMDAICKTFAEKQEDWQEAYIWLTIGCSCCLENGIRSILIDDLPRLKKWLHAALFRQLFASVARYAKNAGEIADLLKIAEEPFKKQLREKLVSASFSAGFVRKFFPFDGWEEKTAQKAIAVLVEAGELPTEKMAELPEPLQKFAVEQMETRAQIESLKANVQGIVGLSCQLYPAAERFLFSCNKEAALSYIEKYKMADSSFLYILTGCFNSGGEMVFAYAKKWRLSEQQYLAIMQSPYVASAPYLKQYVQKAA